MCILLFSASIYVVKSFFLLRHPNNDPPVSFDLHGCLIIFSRLHRTTYFAAYHPYLFMQTTMDIRARHTKQIELTIFMETWVVIINSCTKNQQAGF